jgi:hypothetical protein
LSSVAPCDSLQKQAEPVAAAGLQRSRALCMHACSRVRDVCWTCLRVVWRHQDTQVRPEVVRAAPPTVDAVAAARGQQQLQLQELLHNVSRALALTWVAAGSLRVLRGVAAAAWCAHASDMSQPCLCSAALTHQAAPAVVHCCVLLCAAACRWSGPRWVVMPATMMMSRRGLLQLSRIWSLAASGRTAAHRARSCRSRRSWCSA